MKLGEMNRYDTVLPTEVRREFTQRVSQPARTQTKGPGWALPAAIVLASVIIAASVQKPPQTVTVQPVPTPAPVAATPPDATQPETRVIRAELVNLPAPRAELVFSRPDHWIETPYGMNVFIHLKGSLVDAAFLPQTGNHIGDAWQVGSNVYAWLVTPGATQPTWVDP